MNASCNWVDLFMPVQVSSCVYFFNFIHQSTSRKRNTISQEKHNLKRIKQLSMLLDMTMSQY